MTMMTIISGEFYSFFELLQENVNKQDTVKPPRKSIIVKEVEKHDNGLLLQMQSIFRSAVRYTCNYSDNYVFCNRVLSQIISVSTS